jgi:hypothetical protein
MVGDNPDSSVGLLELIDIISYEITFVATILEFFIRLRMKMKVRFQPYRTISKNVLILHHNFTILNHDEAGSKLLSLAIVYHFSGVGKVIELLIYTIK